jgi:hypothetical protein
MVREDLIAIEWECTRLINLYALLTDEARWEDIVALYAEEGLMTRPTAPNDPIVGHEALLAAFTARPPRISRHVCANIVITVESATEACGESVILLYTGSPAEDGGLPLCDGPPLIGTYKDRFRLTDKGWRFSERRGGLDFRKG